VRNRATFPFSWSQAFLLAAGALPGRRDAAMALCEAAESWLASFPPIETSTATATCSRHPSPPPRTPTARPSTARPSPPPRRGRARALLGRPTPPKRRASRTCRTRRSSAALSQGPLRGAQRATPSGLRRGRSGRPQIPGEGAGLKSPGSGLPGLGLGQGQRRRRRTKVFVAAARAVPIVGANVPAVVGSASEWPRAARTAPPPPPTPPPPHGGMGGGGKNL
jgi:hypothetical protein